MWKKTFTKSHFQKKTFKCVNLLESFCNCRIYLQLLADRGSNGRTYLRPPVVCDRDVCIVAKQRTLCSRCTRRQQSWLL